MMRFLPVVALALLSLVAGCGDPDSAGAETEDAAATPAQVRAAELREEGWGEAAIAGKLREEGLIASASPGTEAAESRPRDGTTVRDRPAHCVDVPRVKLSWIEQGLTIRGGGSLQGAQAVRSGAHQALYFVSADLEGPGLEGPGHVATWAVNNLERGTGIVLSVSEQAKEFSDWPDGARTDAATSMRDPGARESQECVG